MTRLKQISEQVVARFGAAHRTLGTAESLTGGMLASSLIDCPGASAAVLEGHVTYSNEAKTRVLGVRPETLQAHGAVSAECALEMAEGARSISGATWALSTTGVAGPDGASARQLMLRGDREWIRTLACQNALDILRLRLLGK